MIIILPDNKILNRSLDGSRARNAPDGKSKTLISTIQKLANFELNILLEGDGDVNALFIRIDVFVRQI